MFASCLFLLSFFLYLETTGQNNSEQAQILQHAAFSVVEMFLCFLTFFDSTISFQHPSWKQPLQLWMLIINWTFVFYQNFSIWIPNGSAPNLSQLFRNMKDFYCKIHANSCMNLIHHEIHVQCTKKTWNCWNKSPWFIFQLFISFFSLSVFTLISFSFSGFHSVQIFPSFHFSLSSHFFSVPSRFLVLFLSPFFSFPLLAFVSLIQTDTSWKVIRYPQEKSPNSDSSS
jgi:hypothetical protein